MPAAHAEDITCTVHRSSLPGSRPGFGQSSTTARWNSQAALGILTGDRSSHLLQVVTMGE